MRVCSGCGVQLQSDDPNLVGFVPESALDREQVTCRRCYRITHYGEISSVGMDRDSFRNMLAEAGRGDALFMCVVDLFDFAGSWFIELPRLMGGNPFILVANKLDLLPRQTNLDKIMRWLTRELEKRGVQPTAVVLCSAERGDGIEELRLALAKHSQGRIIYAVGMANVGKSSLLNQLTSKTASVSHLTTSRFPGTTLGQVSIGIPGIEANVVDTPGIMTKHRLTDLVCSSCIALITPDRELNPRVFQLNAEQALFLGGLCRIDYVEGVSQSFVCYVANQLTVHRTKLANADSLIALHRGDLLTPPCMYCGDHLRSFVSRDISIKRGQPADIVISGLGWISIRGEACNVRVHVPRGVDISVRRAII